MLALHHTILPCQKLTGMGKDSMYHNNLCRDGRFSVSFSGSLVLGITPMMVLFNEVPFNNLLFTSCMFPGVSTLIRIVEPGKSTPSWVNSNGKRVGI